MHFFLKWVLGMMFFVSSLLAQQTHSMFSIETRYLEAKTFFEKQQYAIAGKLFESLYKDLNYQIPQDQIWLMAQYYKLRCDLALNSPDIFEKMEQFLEQNPSFSFNTEAIWILAKISFDKEKYIQAKKWFEKLNSKNISEKDIYEYYFKLGYCLFKLDELEKAAFFFQKVVDSANSYQNRAIYYYGIICYWNNKLANALESFEKLIKIEKNSQLQFYVVHILFSQGEYQKALTQGLALYNKPKKLKEPSTNISFQDTLFVLEYDKKSLKILLGQAYFHLKNYPKTIEFLEGQKFDNTYKQTLLDYQLGISYFFTKNYKKSIEYLSKINTQYINFRQQAYYYMGHAYIALNDKSQAIDKFKIAKTFNTDKQIQEESNYNFIKLCYEIGDNTTSLPEIIESFQLAFPESPHRLEIRNLLLSYFMTTTDYYKALIFIQKQDLSALNIKISYQRLLYLYGIQQFLEGQYDNAIKYLSNALDINFHINYKEVGLFWIGEAFFQKKQYDKAVEYQKKYLKTTVAYTNKQHEYAQYNIGYAYYYLDSYDIAASYFHKYLLTATSKHLKNDALLRCADSYFMSKQYIQAIPLYDQYINKKLEFSDYALYQKSLCYGLMGQKDIQIKTLKLFKEDYIKSEQRPKALLELADFLVLQNNIPEAEAIYTQIIEQYYNENYARIAELQLAMTLYNKGNFLQALALLKKTAETQKGTVYETKACLMIKKIYENAGQIEEYMGWIKNVSPEMMSISSLDSAAFIIVEKRFLNNDYKATIVNASQYLKKFPNGNMRLPVLEYASIAAQNLDNDTLILQYMVALDSLEKKIDAKRLSEIIRIYLSQKKYSKAIPYLLKASSLKEAPKLAQDAIINLMNLYFSQENIDLAVFYAKKVIETNNTPLIQLEKAYWIMANQTQIDDNSVIDYFEKLENSKNSLYKAKALYTKALVLNKKAQYILSNKIIFDLIKNVPQQTLWIGKAMVLLAKNYYKIQDYFQANYTLKNIFSHFNKYPEVLQEAEKIQIILDSHHQKEMLQKQQDSIQSQKPQLIQEIVPINE